MNSINPRIQGHNWISRLVKLRTKIFQWLNEWCWRCAAGLSGTVPANMPAPIAYSSPHARDVLIRIWDGMNLKARKVDQNWIRGTQSYRGKETSEYQRKICGKNLWYVLPICTIMRSAVLKLQRCPFPFAPKTPLTLIVDQDSVLDT